MILSAAFVFLIDLAGYLPAAAELSHRQREEREKELLISCRVRKDTSIRTTRANLF